jgi:hypothetical protein
VVKARTMPAVEENSGTIKFKKFISHYYKYNSHENGKPSRSLEAGIKWVNRQRYIIPVLLNLGFASP